MRQSLSAAVANHAEEVRQQNSNENHIQQWLHNNRSSKPPLFRHQMMMNASEPDFSASQNNSLSVSNQNPTIVQNLVSNPLNEQLQHSFNRGQVVVNPQRNNQEGSDRKNPLAQLLASANASVDTTANPANQLVNNLMTTKAPQPMHVPTTQGQLPRNFFVPSQEDLTDERIIEGLL